MKILKPLIIGILLVSLLGCKKEESENLGEVSADRYVELLKAGKYDSFDLPEFTSNSIPALLAYRNDSQIITDFPTNMISSYAMPECTLGMYVLWTIESIRAVAIDSEYLIGRFPSQNPIVQKKDEPFDIVDGNEVHEIIAKSYYDWWENNKNMEFNAFNEIDPLSNTAFRWH
jgi:hypothetical protein